MTVLGEVDGSALGVTLPHEHVFINFIEERSALFNDYTTMLEEVRHYKASGGGTLVELTARDSTPGAVWDPGGSVRAASGKSGGPLAASAAEALRDVSQESGAHIVVGTGFYREPFIDREWFDRHSVDEIADLLVRDITEGLEGTDVRAGIIGELGAHRWYVSAAEERSYRAAARAHKRTRLTISTHASPWPTGLLQLDILEYEGVDLRRVVIGGCDKINLPEYHDAIVARGGWVEFDTIRGGNQREIDLRLHYVCRMVEAGHLERILISNDIARPSSSSATAEQATNTSPRPSLSYFVSGASARINSSVCLWTTLAECLPTNSRMIVPVCPPAAADSASHAHHEAIPSCAQMVSSACTSATSSGTPCSRRSAASR